MCLYEKEGFLLLLALKGSGELVIISVVRDLAGVLGMAGEVFVGREGKGGGGGRGGCCDVWFDQIGGFVYRMEWGEGGEGGGRGWVKRVEVYRFDVGVER